MGSRGSAPYDFRTRGARLENGLNLFGAGMNLGPLRPPPAAARIYQIHVSPLFPLAPLVCLAFSDLFGRGRCPHRPASGHRPPYNTHNIRSSYAVGRDDPARLVVTTTPPHPLVLASSACPRAVSLAPAGQFTFSFISAETAETHSLRCSSSPQRDRWRWVTLGTPNGHLPPGVGKAWAGRPQAAPTEGSHTRRPTVQRAAPAKRADDIRPYEISVI